MNDFAFRRTSRRHAILLAMFLFALFELSLSSGCGHDRTTDPAGLVLGDQAPPMDETIRVVAIDGNTFELRMRYAPTVGTGKLRGQYRLDPLLEGAPEWGALPDGEATVRLPRGGAIRWTVTLRLLDEQGTEVTSRRYEFTDSNVLPASTILSPRPNNQQPVSTPPSFTVRWIGNDPDGLTSPRPVGYVTRVVRAGEIQPENPNGVSPGVLAEFFTTDRATNPAAWTVHGPADTLRTLLDLPLNAVHYIAVLAQDEAGGEEAQYSLTSNVLQFRPTLNFIGPRITLFNELFYRTKNTASLDPTPLVTISLRPEDATTLNWTAQPPTGRVVNGFRWAVDIADIADETPRTGPDDLSHWSEWSNEVVAAQVGPFPDDAGTIGKHLAYVMVRDDLGGQSLATIQVDVFGHEPGADLLVLDDMYGTPTELDAGQPPGGNIRVVGNYPMEAEQDSFHVAVGGFPDQFRIRSGTPGAISTPGIFSGFAADTLDYRFWPGNGYPSPFKYRVVAWYTDTASSFRSGDKFGSANPATAIRTINSVNRVNTLTQYVQQGGKLWIFGEGMTPAIAYGWFSRYGTPPAPPFTSGADPRRNVLYPGNFLYDFCMLRSELSQAGSSNTTTTLAQQMRSAIPYLPEFRGPATQDDRSHDPRIGPGAERTALRWSGLPRLTLANYRGASIDPGARSIPLTWVISKPLAVVENGESVLDTLYLNQARTYDPTGVMIPRSDGFPNAVHYHGANHGEIVWFGFPLYFFESAQGREVVRVTMRALGIEPQAAAERRGVGTAHSAPVVVGDAGDASVPFRRR